MVEGKSRKDLKYKCEVYFFRITMIIMIVILSRNKKVFSGRAASFSQLYSRPKVQDRTLLTPQLVIIPPNVSRSPGWRRKNNF